MVILTDSQLIGLQNAKKVTCKKNAFKKRSFDGLELPTFPQSLTPYRLSYPVYDTMHVKL